MGDREIATVCLCQNHGSMNDNGWLDKRVRFARPAGFLDEGASLCATFPQNSHIMNV